jgi:hypothetical protein
VNAINHLWEGIKYYEVTDKMIQCGGLYPIHLHEQEYEEIKTEHLQALQQTRDTEKIPEAIKFYNVGIYVLDLPWTQLYYHHFVTVVSVICTYGRPFNCTTFIQKSVE